MPSISVASLEALNQSGVLKLTNKTLMVGDDDADMLTTPFDDTGLLQAFPSGYFSGGGVDTDGFTVSRDMSSDAVNIDQDVHPVRNDVTADALSLKVKWAETTSRVVQAIDNNLRIADVSMTPFFHATRPASGIQPQRRGILVSEDTTRNVVIVEFFPNLTLTAAGDKQKARSTALLYDHTFGVFPDPDLLDDDGNPTDYAMWIGGSGWASLVGETIPSWQATHAYALNAEVSANGGHVYKVTTAGTSGSTAPTWPSSGTVSDGTVTWTFQS